MLRKSAEVRGRVRMLARVSDPAAAHAVGLEFSTVELPDGTAQFWAALRSVDSPVAGLKWMLSTYTRSVRGFPATDSTQGFSVGVTGTRSQRLENIPGVGSFFMEGKRFEMPAGTRMTWTTVDLAPSTKRLP